MAKITFKPKQVSKMLLSALPERAQEVLTSRYGLGKVTEKMTLESIGEKYGITRERVRQIENHALVSIRKSEAFEKTTPVFEELEHYIESLGGVISEIELLSSISKDKSTQNHMHFLLVLGNPFVYKKEDSEFTHRWYTNEEFAESIHTALRNLYTNLSDNELVTESVLLESFLNEVKHLSDQYLQEEILRRWLSLSKTIAKNPLGDWGPAASSNVKAKGMRDFAYLAIKRHGSPMHFTEVAESITELFNKKAHVATCHNELIKDKRFVLVGRGLYALSEWGYSSGVVKDVLKTILEKEGPLSREELIDRIRKERYVKDNTISVNLQDTSIFKKDKGGKYSLF
ncbi:MAG: sigma factor-like helix-turn-helix DNA-binding protein [Candidatus Paceibacterota bacterium]